MIGQWLRWGLCSKPLLPHKLEREQTSAECLRNSPVSTAGEWRPTAPRCFCLCLPLLPPPRGNAPILQVLGGQMGAAERPAGLGEDDHRVTRASSAGGLVRLTVVEGTPLSLSHQGRSQQPHPGGAPPAHLCRPPASLWPGLGGISQQSLVLISALLPRPDT